MNDWTSGYVADIGYTFGYYLELNPMHARLAFLNAGLVMPVVGTACELGFVQGLSINMHAAASVTQWSGTDFNPSQASFGQELAASNAAGARLYDQAFSEFANRGDLPDFDYIGLHGIWSWISDENRTVIVDFIRRKLKVGGVLYISYNTLPGWAGFAPMRHLLTEHAEVLGSEGHGIVKRIDGAIEFAENLIATNPAYARANPLVFERIKSIKTQNRKYLAHEYFNRDWNPMHFSSMAQWLTPAKLSYACSANYIEQIDPLNLTTEQQQFLAAIPDKLFRESVRDFMVNQQFRKDYWVKGPRQLSALEQIESFRQQKVMLKTHRSDVTLKVKGALGDGDMTESVYKPILDFLADHKSKTWAQIEQGISSSGLKFPHIRQALIVLAGAGHLVSVQDDAVINKVRKNTDKLNTVLANRARSNDDIGTLVSPVTGGGVGITRFPQLFLLALNQGQRQPAEWANWAWKTLDMQAQRIIKEGKPLETAEENLAELTLQATTFAEKQLPILKALQIA